MARLDITLENTLVMGHKFVIYWFRRKDVGKGEQHWNSGYREKNGKEKPDISVR